MFNDSTKVFFVFSSNRVKSASNCWICVIKVLTVSNRYTIPSSKAYDWKFSARVRSEVVVRVVSRDQPLCGNHDVIELFPDERFRADDLGENCCHGLEFVEHGAHEVVEVEFHDSPKGAVRGPVTHLQKEHLWLVCRIHHLYSLLRKIQYTFGCMIPMYVCMYSADI